MLLTIQLNKICMSKFTKKKNNGRPRKSYKNKLQRRRRMQGNLKIAIIAFKVKKKKEEINDEYVSFCLFS